MAFQIWILVIAILVPLFPSIVEAQAYKPNRGTFARLSSDSTASVQEATAQNQAKPAAQNRLVNISNQDMDLMRQQPSSSTLRTVYTRYKPLLTAALPAWGLDDDGLALIFATLVAYQSAPYGTRDGPNRSLQDMFALSRMECSSYSHFVAMLFRELQLGNRWKVYIHGFDGAKFIGNHAQVIAVDTTSGQAGSTKKTGLVLDATVGVVARVKLDALPLPASASDVLVLGLRQDEDVSTVSALKGFRNNVVKGLETPGTYVYEKMIYQEDASVSYGVGTLDPNLRTAIGVVGRTLYVLPADEADTSRGIWQEFYTSNIYNMPPPYDPAVAPYRACDAPAPGRPKVCVCFRNKDVIDLSVNGSCAK